MGRPPPAVVVGKRRGLPLAISVAVAVVLVVVYITIAFNYVSITTNRFVDHPVSEASREIAARLTKSKQEVPHYYLSVDIEVNTNPAPSSEFFCVFKFYFSYKCLCFL